MTFEDFFFLIILTLVQISKVNLLGAFSICDGPISIRIRRFRSGTDYYVGA